MPNTETTAFGNDIKFEALFNSASMAIIVVDKNGVIVMANPLANNLFAYNDNSMVGEVLEKLIPQRYHHKHVGYRDHYIEQPKARTMGLGMTLSAQKKDGTEFPVEISLGQFKNGDEQ